MGCVLHPGLVQAWRDAEGRTAGRLKDLDGVHPGVRQVHVVVHQGIRDPSEVSDGVGVVVDPLALEAAVLAKGVLDGVLRRRRGSERVEGVDVEGWQTPVLKLVDVAHVCASRQDLAGTATHGLRRDSGAALARGVFASKEVGNLGPIAQAGVMFEEPDPGRIHLVVAQGPQLEGCNEGHSPANVASDRAVVPRDGEHAPPVLLVLKDR
mmetsp:Transcript_14324/g.32574  ORF Transcript_14324/g.32574 Transcript_14324/m.32574 type:complete len:209 (+) Transcript_14324:326-952(+)